MRIIRWLGYEVALNPIVLLCVAALAGIIGAALVLEGPSSAARAERAERLVPLRASALDDGASGREVLLEGHISADNPAVYRDFVAFVREEYTSDQLNLRGDDDSPRWVVVERNTPALLIALPDGEARLANEDYALDTTAVTVQEAEPTTFKGAVQSRGFVAGSPVLALGTLEDSASGRAVRAELLYAGTREQYIAEMRRLSGNTVPIGAGLLVVCAASTAALVWRVRGVLREFAAEERAASA